MPLACHRCLLLGYAGNGLRFDGGQPPPLMRISIDSRSAQGQQPRMERHRASRGINGVEWYGPSAIFVARLPYLLVLAMLASNRYVRLSKREAGGMPCSHIGRVLALTSAGQSSADRHCGLRSAVIRASVVGGGVGRMPCIGGCLMGPPSAPFRGPVREILLLLISWGRSQDRAQRAGTAEAS
jgi:hypothetical protein